MFWRNGSVRLCRRILTLQGLMEWEESVYNSDRKNNPARSGHNVSNQYVAGNTKPMIKNSDKKGRTEGGLMTPLRSVSNKWNSEQSRAQRPPRSYSNRLIALLLILQLQQTSLSYKSRGIEQQQRIVNTVLLHVFADIAIVEPDIDHMDFLHMVRQKRQHAVRI